MKAKDLIELLERNETAGSSNGTARTMTYT